MLAKQYSVVGIEEINDRFFRYIVQLRNVPVVPRGFTRKLKSGAH